MTEAEYEVVGYQIISVGDNCGDSLEYDLREPNFSVANSAWEKMTSQRPTESLRYYSMERRLLSERIPEPMTVDNLLEAINELCDTYGTNVANLIRDKINVFKALQEEQP